jgi:hypothetical protein
MATTDVGLQRLTARPRENVAPEAIAPPASKHADDSPRLRAVPGSPLFDHFTRKQRFTFF